MRQGRFSSGAGRTALCGVLAALSAALLYLASMVPSGKIGVAALAGLPPVAAVIAAGRGAGVLCWAVSAVLGLLLSQEKWLALLYLLFLGLYPVVKSVLEGFKSRALEWLCKLLYFNAVFVLFWTLFRPIFLPALPAFLQKTALAAAACNAVFLVYDIGLSRLIGVFYRRIGSIMGQKS